MNDRASAEATLLANFQWTQRAIHALGRRQQMSNEDTDDFSSWVLLKLLENDYGILRQFRGESSLKTYLTVVIAMLYREYRVISWGRWRPSASARKAGRAAVLLETMVYRDGYNRDQAILTLMASGITTLGRRQLSTMFESLPRRTPRRVFYPLDAIAASSGSANAEDLVLVQESLKEQCAAAASLNLAMENLPRMERKIIRMRFLEELSVADIARRLQLPQKSLYRRLERTLASMRKYLEKSGLSVAEVRSLLDGRTT